MKHGWTLPLMVFLSASLSWAQVPEQFNHQGRLINGTNLYNGSVAFNFRLFNAPSGGSQLYLENDTLPVVDGLYSTVIGDNPASGSLIKALTNSEVYLQITVSGATLLPRERISSSAYSLATRGWQVDTSDVPIIVGNPALNKAAAEGWGSFIGGGTMNEAKGPCVTIGGGYKNSASNSSATIAGGNQNRAVGLWATVGGGFSNTAFASDGLFHCPIVAGGFQNVAYGSYATVSGGEYNLASNLNATVGGGYRNKASGRYATIAGGSANEASGMNATVGGGTGNKAIKTNPYGIIHSPTVAGGEENKADGSAAFVGGGYQNKAQGEGATVGGGEMNGVSNQYGAVVGGQKNHVECDHGFVGGGLNNAARDSTGFGDAVVAGGEKNTADGPAATVGGGFQNTASQSSATVGGGNNNSASADFATIPGGWGNRALGVNSFAAGRRAQALDSGSFVWGDNTDAEVSSYGANCVVFRCNGGVRFMNTAGDLYAQWVPGNDNWTVVSDRATKENIRPVDARAVAEKVANLPLNEWNYIGYQDKKHIGPMAQDFHVAFPFNNQDKAIDSGDLQGVTLAAVQGLYQMIGDLRAENLALRNRLQKLESR